MSTKGTLLCVFASLVAYTCFADINEDLSTKAENAFVQGDYDMAADCFSKLIKLNDTDGYLGRGSVYLTKGEYDKAIKDLTKMIQLRPMPIAFKLRGDAFSHKGEHSKAADDYSQYIKYNNGNAGVYIDRSEEYFHLGWLDAALADCNTAILMLGDASSDSNQLEMAYIARGSIFNREAKYDRAFEDYSKVIQINSTNGMAYNLRGWALLGMGKYGDSISNYEKAVSLNPNDDLAYRRLAWISAVCPDAKYRDGRKALEYGKRACELTKWKDPLCLLTLAAAYAESGQFKEAVAWEQKAIDSGLKGDDLKDSKKRMELYKQKKAYRMKPPTASVN